MNTWKKTQQQLGLKDEEISVSVKKLITKHGKDLDDLETIKQALKATNVSKADREEYETARGVLEAKLVETDQTLSNHIKRLHKDRDLNAARRERLNKTPGPGRGKKKNKEPENAAAPPTATTPSPAAPASTSEPAATKTDPSPAGEKKSETAATASAGTKPNATTTTTSKPQAATTKPAETTPQKKKGILSAVIGFLVGGALGVGVTRLIK